MSPFFLLNWCNFFTMFKCTFCLFIYFFYSLFHFFLFEFFFTLFHKLFIFLFLDVHFCQDINFILVGILKDWIGANILGVYFLEKLRVNWQRITFNIRWVIFSYTLIMSRAANLHNDFRFFDVTFSKHVHKLSISWDF